MKSIPHQQKKKSEYFHNFLYKKSIQLYTFYQEEKYRLPSFSTNSKKAFINLPSTFIIWSISSHMLSHNKSLNLPTHILQLPQEAFMFQAKINFHLPFSYLLKCVFLLRASSIFGCNFPICSSSFDNVLVLFFFSPFWACSFSSFDCRRLLKNIETLRSSTVPPVREVELSIVCCWCRIFWFFPSSFVISLWFEWI